MQSVTLINWSVSFVCLCSKLHPVDLDHIYDLFFQLNHFDNSGQCACIHAAVNGHLEALVYLLQCDWSVYEGQVTKVEAMQQSFIVAAAMGHKDVSLL